VTAIEHYRIEPAGCCEYDPAFARVAEEVRALVTARLPTVRVEHIGSTAVPGCAGKGIVDLLLAYPAGQLEAARDALDSLGFQHQRGRDPFPESRPMRVATVEIDGRRYRTHVHVVCDEDAECAVLLRFRDALRDDPALRDAYVARKREILARGITDTEDYSEAKGDFITAVIAPR
jgi:GrpB-like predicted nucleotidyltransferase (UPF0157 family)